MLTFKTPKDVTQFVADSRRDAEPERRDQQAYIAKTRCYQLGLQWIGYQSGPAGGGYAKLVRWATDWVGRSGQIRATINRVTKHTIQVASATNPSRLDVDGLTTDRATGGDDAELADLIESIANIAIEQCGLLASSRSTNYERTVAGDHGIGLSLEQTPMVVEIEGEPTEVTGATMRSFDFDATRITLDPHNQSRNLRDHEWVIYSDVLTIHRLKRMFGDDVLKKVDEDKLQDVGQLMPLEMEFSTLSGGLLYSQYRQHSRTKGVRIHFVHTRGANPARFDNMYVVIEAGGNEPLVPNFKSPQSPFGGDGLPYMMLRGHRRPSMRRSISDVGMQLDDQDKLNMMASLYVQQVAAYTGQGKWLADRNFFRRMGDDAKVVRNIQRNNVLLYDAGSPNAKPPFYVPMPEPSQALELTMSRMEDGMREQAFRSEVHQGRLKTHQTNRNVQLSVELSELPLDDRINDDVLEYERFIAMLTATAARAVHAGDPMMLRELADVGFGEQEFTRVASVDPDRIPTQLKLRQQNLRFRSRSSREQQLYDLASAQLLDPMEVKRILADELDMPISTVDKQVIRFCRQVAERVMAGEEYFPFPLGARVSFMLEELTRSMTDKRAQGIPGAVERLAQAIQIQEQVLAEQLAEQEQAEQPPGPQDTLNLSDFVRQAG